MKFVLAAVLALAISTDALYPLPAPVVPSVVYGVPEESKPEIVPIKTEYSYTVPVPTIEVHHEEPHVAVAPVAPILPVHPEIHEHSVLAPTYGVPAPTYGVPAPTYGVPAPSTHIYAPSAYSTHGLVLPHNFGYSFEHSSYPYSYGYSAPQVPFPQQVVYGSSHLNLFHSGIHGVLPTVPTSEVVTVTGPAPVSTVLTESHHVPEIVHEVQHPVVTNYEYHLPQVVVADIPKHVVPQTVYGVPEIPQPVVPHSSYGVPLLK